jgi:hypothetical protein
VFTQAQRLALEWVMCVDSTRPRPLYLQGKTQNPLNKRLGEENLTPTGIRSPDFAIRRVVSVLTAISRP